MSGFDFDEGRSGAYYPSHMKKYEERFSSRFPRMVVDTLVGLLVMAYLVGIGSIIYLSVALFR